LIRFSLFLWSFASSPLTQSRSSNRSSHQYVPPPAPSCWSQPFAPAPVTNYFVSDTWLSVLYTDFSVVDTECPALNADCSVLNTSRIGAGPVVLRARHICARTERRLLRVRHLDACPVPGLLRVRDLTLSADCGLLRTQLFTPGAGRGSLRAQHCALCPGRGLLRLRRFALAPLTNRSVLDASRPVLPTDYSVLST